MALFPMWNVALEIDANVKIIHLLLLIRKIFPFELVTNINPDQRDVDELAFQPW